MIQTKTKKNKKNELLNNKNMQKKIITVYKYAELSPDAKEKARAQWNEINDNPLMQSHMINVLKEKLEERGIKYDTDSIDVRYSLSNSQGDGFMFVGKIEYKGHTVTIKHGDSHYYHKYTADFDFENTEEKCTLTAADMQSFEKKYRIICDEMERIGYDEIDYQQSEQYFQEACEANELTFRQNGVLEVIS